MRGGRKLIGALIILSCVVFLMLGIIVFLCCVLSMETRDIENRYSSDSYDCEWEKIDWNKNEH